jgi:hypothetical protein
VLQPFHKLRPGATDAQIHGNVLWAAKPRFPGSVFFTRKNYHVADYNLFYGNVRANAVGRVAVFLGVGSE